MTKHMCLSTIFLSLGSAFNKIGTHHILFAKKVYKINRDSWGCGMKTRRIQRFIENKKEIKTRKEFMRRAFTEVLLGRRSILLT